MKRILFIFSILLLLSSDCFARSGYKIYITTVQGNYSGVTPIDCGLVKIRTVSTLTPGNYCAVATAYIGTNESGYSNEVCFTKADEPVITFAWDESPQVKVPTGIFWW